MTNHFKNSVTLLTVIVCLTACSKQNWYQGAQSAKEAQCLKEPISEYEDCMKQSDQSYDEYSRSRDALLEENTQPDDKQPEDKQVIENPQAR